MNGARASWVRGGLLFLALVSVVLGVHILLSPEGFFRWPWVNMGMDYNPHLMLDHGAMHLAVATPLGWAAATMNPVLVRAALASSAVWSGTHFLIHLGLRPHMAAHTSAGEANLLLGALGVGAAVPIMLFLLTLDRRGLPSPGRQGRVAGPPDSP
jgi:hypothetical protein